MPADTLARVRPLMSQMGITRIANITGLDYVGVPVVMVTRPNSRSLAVSQGKGLSLDAAKASGLMEAVEIYHAETITAPLKLGSARELAVGHDLIDVGGLPRSVNSRYDDHFRMLWIEGRDLLCDAPRWVPHELVHTNYTLPRPPDCGCFPANTNGLASGNHRLEAITHGVCEVIERDAVTLWHHRSEAAKKQRVLDLGTVHDPACREVLDKFERADIDVRVWDVTTDVGVAAFYCLVLGRRDVSADPEFGAGCHPAREVALLRALTEAAQARTTYIAGSRDDFTPDLYSPDTRARRLRTCRGLVETQPLVRDFNHAPTFEADTVDDDVAWLLERLRSVGTGQVVVVDLTKEAFNLPVVRVVIPGLEGPYKGEHSDYTPGPRARRMQGVGA